MTTLRAGLRYAARPRCRPVSVRAPSRCLAQSRYTQRGRAAVVRLRAGFHRTAPSGRTTRFSRVGQRSTLRSDP
jgi:hypothetical protein